MTLTVRLPGTIESQLTRFCETMGMSKSQVVQTALKDWFAKPIANNGHPLLAFAQAASAATPAADWAGPYSKERLRERALARAGAHLASEPVADYALVPKKPATRRSATARIVKNISNKPMKDEGLTAICSDLPQDSVSGLKGA